MLAIIYFYYFHIVLRKKRPSIVYESDNFKIINKTEDLRINSNVKTQYTVETFLRETFPRCANPKLVHNFYFVHRLDYATSGILCIPTKKHACKIISEIFQKRTSEKYYVAIVRGLLSQRLMVLSKPIGEDNTRRQTQKMCTDDSEHCVNSRSATTVLLELENGFYEDYPGTKLLIRPITGRRHQIRVHCSHLGHTIVGDYTYSNKKDTKPQRMFLHSIRLILPNDLEHLDVQTPDPFDAEKLYKNWVIVNRYHSVEEGYEILREHVNNGKAI